MRLSFPQAEHKDVIVHTGEIRIGSDPDNDVSLVSSGISPRHARLLIDRRGYLLFGLYDQNPEWSGEPRLRVVNAVYRVDSEADRVRVVRR